MRKKIFSKWYKLNLSYHRPHFFSALVLHGKCSKISNTLLFLFSNITMVVIMAEINIMLVRIENREEPDQAVSSEAV